MEETDSETDYIPSLDLLRGMAALSVCFFHATGSVPTFLAGDSWLKMAGMYGHHGVSVFFVVSGFVIPWSLFHRAYHIGHFRQFMLKRMLRIEPPYLATIALMLGLNYVSSLMPWHHGAPAAVDWIQVGLHVGYLAAFFDYAWINQGFWTLAIEFQYYLLIGGLFPLLVCKPKWIRWAVLAGFCGLDFLLPSGNFVFHYSGLFALGILAFQYRSRLIDKTAFAAGALLVAGWLYLRHDLHVMITALLAAVTILSIQRAPRVFKFIGGISYSLYLLHSPIGERVINLGSRFVHDPVLRNGMVIVSMLVSVAVAWIFFRLVEVPVLKFSRRIRYDRGGQEQPEEKLQQQIVN